MRNVLRLNLGRMEIHRGHSNFSTSPAIYGWEMAQKRFQPRLRGFTNGFSLLWQTTMAHTFHQLYFHFIWGTHSREPLIERLWRPQFLLLLNDEVKKRGGISLRHNAMPDHTHLLVRLRPTTLISEFIGQVKGATSYRANQEISPRCKLRWQEGYGVVSLRRDECDTVARYIDNQEAHHRHGRVSETLEMITAETDDWESFIG